MCVDILVEQKKIKINIKNQWADNNFKYLKDGTNISIYKGELGKYCT